MAENTTQAKTDSHDGQFTLKKTRKGNLRIGVTPKEYLTPRAFRKRCNVGLQVGKTITYEELYNVLSQFAVEQWDALPKNASDWERGQIDGLFWAMDKLDELVEK